MEVRLGVRKSELAKSQSQPIFQHLEKSGLKVEWVELVSSGDKERSIPLYEIQPSQPGLFTKELENALLEKKIDLAIHSLKDLPTIQPPGLEVLCIPARENIADCLVIPSDKLDRKKILGIREGLTIGTSSLRREAQLLSYRSDLKLKSIRGNVPTRVRKVREKEFDAVVLARAGLNRLRLDLSGLAMLDLPFVSAPGQGALAVETRTDAAPELRAALAQLHDPKVAEAVKIEREILRAVEGGCTLPIGVNCEKVKSTYNLKAFLGNYRHSEGGNRKWISFHHFGISREDSSELIRITVEHLRSIQNGERPLQGSSHR